MRPDFRARSTISRPIPAQSPSVMPMRGFVVLMLVIGPFLIDYEHDYHPSPRLRLGRRAAAGVKQTPNANSDKSRTGRPTPSTQLKRLDVGFFAQAGDPALLNLLRFLLQQFFFNIGARLGERFRGAALFVFNFEDVIIPSVIDDVANSADWHVAGDLVQW